MAAVAIAALLWAGPSQAAPLQVSMMEGASPCVALTFDDGPDVELTPKLLSILESKGAVATFFVVGYRAATWPAPVARANQDGFEIDNHSWDHPVLPRLDSDAALRELTRTDATIQQITGHPPAYTRAPYGSVSPRIAGLSQRTFVGWSVDTFDWKYPDVNRITSVAVNKAVNGSIVLMHDIHPRTIDAVPGIIDGLRARGFRLVTVSELLGGGCGGHAIGYDLPGEGPPPPPAKAGTPPVTSAAPKVATPTPPAPPVQTTAHQPFRLYDDDN
jgi:peptidoglycan/xylan/chitin deacetylase (PgdA/CDA1 family)